jgi:His-Xaa-Ser system protein HxsD
MVTADGLLSDADSTFSTTISLDPRIYSKDAILKACYWYTGIAYIHMPESPDEKLLIRVELKQRTPNLEAPKPLTIDEFLPEFYNSLLDFELRRQVEAETASIRQLILAKAFSESGVLEDDPVGVASDPVEESKPNSFVQITHVAQINTLK